MGGNTGVVQPLVSGDSHAGFNASLTTNGVAWGSRQVYRPSDGERRYTVSASQRAAAILSGTGMHRQLNGRRIAVLPLGFSLAERTIAAWRPTPAHGTRDLHRGGMEPDGLAGKPRNLRKTGPSPTGEPHDRSLAVWRQQNTKLACRLQVADRLHRQPMGAAGTGVTTLPADAAGRSFGENKSMPGQQAFLLLGPGVPRVTEGENATGVHAGQPLRSEVCEDFDAPPTPPVLAAAGVGDGGGASPGTVDVAFIGGGNMAKSLLRGLIDSGHDAGRFAVSDPDAHRRGAIEALGVKATAHNQEAVDRAATVVLAVKPQVLGDVLAGLSVPGETLVVSVCAGVPVDAIAGLTSRAQAIVRCMPNTAALLRAGVTALFANANTDAAERCAAERILSAVGKTIWVDKEADLDAVTAVSGSGPAYFFYLMEAMAEAGEGLGLAPEVAASLTVETAWGAARMARETGLPPSALRRDVTSPGGTTEAAIDTLDERGVNGRVIEAIGRARERAREIADGFGPGETSRGE